MDEQDRVSMEEIEAEGATALPDKEVLSLLDINANVDLGLDLRHRSTWPRRRI